MLIHTASATVEHRTAAVFEFFDATASVSGAMMEGMERDEGMEMGEMEKGGKHEVYILYILYILYIYCIYYRYKHSTKHALNLS